jgi:hypothetical protein
MSDSLYIRKHADLSPCGTYRYSLEREWRGTHDPKNWEWFDRDYGQPKPCVFIMLNPSTADAEKDDPTIRRCVSFAKRWNYEALTVLNLFAFRATDPRALLALSHNNSPEGSDNQRIIQMAIEHAGKIVCAWGAHGGHLGQDETVLGWIGDRPRYALGLTKEGHPRHPLYVRADTELVRFRP